MFELFANILLLVFMVFTFFTHVLEAKIPKSYTKNPYNLMPDVWPKVIIALIVICLTINIIKIIRKNKGNPEFTLKAFWKNSLNFFKSKMFLGMLILAGASFVIETLGFVVTNCGKIDRVPCKKHCRGSGHGGNQWGETDGRGCH